MDNQEFKNSVYFNNYFYSLGSNYLWNSDYHLVIACRNAFRGNLDTFSKSNRIDKTSRDNEPLYLFHLPGWFIKGAL